MKDLGVLKYFLGVEVARSSEGIFLSRHKYTLDIISETGLLGAKPASFPIEQNHCLSLAKGAELRDLNGESGTGSIVSSACDLSLTGWCESDWAGCPLTRSSITGWIICFGGSPISWKIKKQHTVSRSSAEAEYRLMTAITAELKWLKALLLDFGVSHSGPMTLFCDSQSALHIAHNSVFRDRTKHIEVDCHYVRDFVQDGLGKNKFHYLLRKLDVSFLPAPT
ncbi:transmembrane signal receptor [Lithospermum erythrorhizon]|uniref:Transmembrane signal receptor n=1 Tax=Lithospermum erythrorhizon TaxID=34254 RepID=A0AAV3Q0I5_LITER